MTARTRTGIRTRTTRRTRTAAVALSVAAGAAGVLTGCASAVGAGPGAAPAAPSGPGSAASAPSAPAGSAHPAAPSSAPAVNGTSAANRLTVSDGTAEVVMNGTTVDFGTVVRDLAWNPAGTRAAFIDGDGNLDTAAADGSDRVTVARAPSGVTWSHPTWQVVPYRKSYGVPASSTILFAASGGGVSRLESVPSKAVDGTPAPLELSPGAGGKDVIPQTGNAWPSAGGGFASTVYADAATGEVYLRDDYLRQMTGTFAAGSEPSLSADGNTVAFVRSVDGHDHLFTESAQSDRTARDLTPDATTDYTEPAWSPDGKTIAVRVPGGVDTVPADGSAAPVRISSVAGLPAYR